MVDQQLYAGPQQLPFRSLLIDLAQAEGPQEDSSPVF
jgi:hypothetical protein